MSDIGAAGEAPAVETTQTPPQEAGFSSEQSIETEARANGWVPESEWRGDNKPAKFLTAQEFVERGQTIIPILRSQMERERKDFATRLERMEKMHEKREQRIRKDAEDRIAALEARKEAYVKQGGEDAVAAVKQIDKAIGELKDDTPDTPAADPEHVTKVINAWTAKQSWWGDKMARAYAMEHSTEIGRADPSMTIEENLRQTEAEVREKFPNLFKKAGANGHAPVDGGGEYPASGQKEGLASKLSKEAREQARKDVAAGLYKTQEDWAKVYFS